MKYFFDVNYFRMLIKENHEINFIIIQKKFKFKSYLNLLLVFAKTYASSLN